MGNMLCLGPEEMYEKLKNKLNDLDCEIQRDIRIRNLTKNEIWRLRCKYSKIENSKKLLRLRHRTKFDKYIEHFEKKYQNVIFDQRVSFSNQHDSFKSFDEDASCKMDTSNNAACYSVSNCGKWEKTSCQQTYPNKETSEIPNSWLKQEFKSLDSPMDTNYFDVEQGPANDNQLINSQFNYENEILSKLPQSQSRPPVHSDRARGRSRRQNTEVESRPGDMVTRSTSKIVTNPEWASSRIALSSLSLEQKDQLNRDQFIVDNYIQRDKEEKDKKKIEQFNQNNSTLVAQNENSFGRSRDDKNNYKDLMVSKETKLGGMFPNEVGSVVVCQDGDFRYEWRNIGGDERHTFLPTLRSNENYKKQCQESKTTEELQRDVKISSKYLISDQQWSSIQTDSGMRDKIVMGQVSQDITFVDPQQFSILNRSIEDQPHVAAHPVIENQNANQVNRRNISSRGNNCQVHHQHYDSAVAAEIGSKNYQEWTISNENSNPQSNEKKIFSDADYFNQQHNNLQTYVEYFPKNDQLSMKNRNRNHQDNKERICSSGNYPHTEIKENQQFSEQENKNYQETIPENEYRNYQHSLRDRVPATMSPHDQPYLDLQDAGGSLFQEHQQRNKSGSRSHQDNNTRNFSKSNYPRDQQYHNFEFTPEAYSNPQHSEHKNRNQKTRTIAELRESGNRNDQNNEFLHSRQYPHQEYVSGKYTEAESSYNIIEEVEIDSTGQLQSRDKSDFESIQGGVKSRTMSQHKGPGSAERVQPNDKPRPAADTQKSIDEEPLEILDMHQYFKDDFDLKTLDSSVDTMTQIETIKHWASTFENKVSNFVGIRYDLEFFVLDEKLMRLIEHLDKLKCREDKEATKKKIEVIEYIKCLLKILDLRAHDDD